VRESHTKLDRGVGGTGHALEQQHPCKENPQLSAEVGHGFSLSHNAARGNDMIAVGDFYQVNSRR